MLVFFSCRIISVKFTLKVYSSEEMKSSLDRPVLSSFSLLYCNLFLLLILVVLVNFGQLLTDKPCVSYEVELRKHRWGWGF